MPVESLSFTPMPLEIAMVGFTDKTGLLLSIQMANNVGTTKVCDTGATGLPSQCSMALSIGTVMACSIVMTDLRSVLQMVLSFGTRMV
jgi:hypothetical protein